MASESETLIEILVRLRHLLILYEGAQRTETNLINLLAIEIEQISEDNLGNLDRSQFVERLIAEHNYPRNFENEKLEEYLDIKISITGFCSYYKLSKSIR